MTTLHRRMLPSRGRQKRLPDMLLAPQRVSLSDPFQAAPRAASTEI